MPWPSWSTTLGLFGTGLRTSCEAGKSRLRRRRIIVNGPSSYSTPSTWASSSSRPAKVHLLDGPSTMGKSQAVTSYICASPSASGPNEVAGSTVSIPAVTFADLANHRDQGDVPLKDLAVSTRVGRAPGRQRRPVAGEIAGSGRGGNRVEQVGLTVQQTGRPYSALLRWTMAS